LGGGAGFSDLKQGNCLFANDGFFRDGAVVAFFDRPVSLAVLLGEQAFLDSVLMDKNFSVIMLDVDKFKRVNDTYGHIIGDRVIEILGKRLANSLKYTELIGRYGGEEFIVFLHCNKAKALKVAWRIKQNVAGYNFIVKPGVFLPITVSLGVATRRPGDSFDELIRRADDRMYKAKRAGGNRISG
jgi:two-component system cell cycle response regulator